MKRFVTMKAMMEQRPQERQLDLLMLTAGDVAPRLFDLAMALDQVAQATQPACIHELGEVYQHHRSLLPVDQDTTPAALSPLRRQNPREEPGALAAHAGIRAGGGQK